MKIVLALLNLHLYLLNIRTIAFSLYNPQLGAIRHFSCKLRSPCFGKSIRKMQRALLLEKETQSSLAYSIIFAVIQYIPLTIINVSAVTS